MVIIVIQPTEIYSEMARPDGVEPPTAWFVARYSIQLSYGRVEARDYPLETAKTQGLRRKERLRCPALHSVRLVELKDSH